MHPVNIELEYDRDDIVRVEQHMLMFPSLLRGLPQRPQLADMLVNKRMSRCLRWRAQDHRGDVMTHEVSAGYQGDIQEAPVHLHFPVLDPHFPEWEMVSPGEWAVRYVGPAGDLSAAGIGKVGYADGAPVPDDATLVVLQAAPFMVGLSHQRMDLQYHIVTVVSRGQDGRMWEPVPYIDPVLIPVRVA